MTDREIIKAAIHLGWCLGHQEGYREGCRDAWKSSLTAPEAMRRVRRCIESAFGRGERDSERD